MAEPIIPGEKLSKSFYMNLKEGLYLVSDLGGFTPLDDRIFEGYVVGHDQKSVQWSEIKKAGADQRCCSIFASEEDYKIWQSGWKRRSNGKGWIRES